MEEKQQGKSNILLDIDQTLISAEPTEDYDIRKNKVKAKKFLFHDMDGYYIVFERPGLQKFLTYLFDNYNVSIWTAASKDYALFIIDKIILNNKPERNIDYIFFSYHCDVSKDKKKGSKNLSMLWDIYKLQNYNQDNTIILDDYNEVYKTQPDNCIIALPFEFTRSDSHNDKFLEELVPHLDKMKEHVASGKSIKSAVKTINNKFQSS